VKVELELNAELIVQSPWLWDEKTVAEAEKQIAQRKEWNRQDMEASDDHRP
jgi:hypothetical protein